METNVQIYTQHDRAKDNR